MAQGSPEPVTLPVNNLMPSHIGIQYMPSVVSAAPCQNIIETDVDVVGITDVARSVNLNDDNSYNPKDQPLDLSLKKKDGCYNPSCSNAFLASISVQSRPTVIRNGYAHKNTDVRRSASSVTSRPAPEPDVSEHFRRSLSGKWPRRQTNYVHFTPLMQIDKEKKNFGILGNYYKSNSNTLNLRRTPSLGASPPQHVVVNNSGIEIEDHFRKALGAEAYEMLVRSRNTQ